MTSMLKMVGERRASWREGGKVGLPASFRRRQGVERRSHVQDVAMHACTFSGFSERCQWQAGRGTGEILRKRGKKCADECDGLMGDKI